MALKRSNIDIIVSNCKKLKTYSNNDLESDFINYLSVPSLESMSIVSIATALFRQSDIRGMILEHWMKYDKSGHMIRGTLHDKSCFEIKRKVLDKVVSLPIPNVLKVRVSNIVKPIQLEILNWMSNDCSYTECIDSIFWSTEGTIDKIKTVKNLIRKETGQYVECTYKLACNCCIEESIHSLWNQLPEKAKKKYLCSEKIYENYKNHLLAFWAHNITSNNLSRFIEKIRQNDNEDLYDFNDSIYKSMFTLALYTENVLAVKYFWNKLTYVEISSNLTHWVQLAVQSISDSPDRYQEVRENADILYFLLSKMNGNYEQKEILQKNPEVILNSLFSDWPWQRFLLPTIKLLWDNIDEKCFVKLLNNITKKIKEKKTTEHLFSRLWCDSPVNLKKHFIQHLLNSSSFRKNTNVFCNLLIVEEVGTIKAILGYANLTDQKQIIFSLVDNQNFINVIHSDKLHLFDELCLDTLSQSDIKIIKDVVVREHGSKTCENWIQSGKWDKVQSFLSWAFYAQEQITHFKNEIKKADITYSLLYPISNYEIANEFLSWCFDSEEEIHKFKIHFAKSKPEIIEIGSEDWGLFENFVDWCFNFEEEIQNFKSDLSQSFPHMNEIYSWIAFGYKFDFIENVINWCCNSQEEIKKFKATLTFSGMWMRLLNRFVTNYKIAEGAWNNYVLIKKLLKLVLPLDEDVVIDLKALIARSIDFDSFLGYYNSDSIMVQKEDLFRLLDKYNNTDNSSDDIDDVDYSITDIMCADYSSSDDIDDVDYRITINNIEDSDDTYSSDSADSEDECNVSDCNTEIELVLFEILKDVENSLSAGNN